MVISYLIVSSVSQLRVTKKSILSQKGVTRKSNLTLNSTIPKEENRFTIAYNYSLELLFHIEAGTGFHVFIG